MYEIIRKEKLNPTITLLEIKAPFIAKKAQAGQFIILRIDEYGERIPLTIADFDREKGTVTIVFQELGYSTKLLGTLNAGDHILDFVGPLGVPTHFGDAKNVCVIGGGVGCAIAYPQAKTLYQNSVNVTGIMGFRNKELVFFEEEMKKVTNKLYICTDNGSYKEKGLVTDVLKRLIEAGENFDLVIAIGPVLMMKYVSLLTKQYNIKTIVSLNPIMIDGTGMCGGCRVVVNNETKFACVDGPDFDGHLVDFDDLFMRLQSYTSQEQEANSHECRLLGGKRNA
ncbi:MAG: sulfide/dihydroorotate dehydrogenase-like FAD/NAD-binding protein [Bacilli bacterium]|nr:sulfide/dihydroorotate dehydrogenase-like FAD/NAD-binding protein [Bacilli bacterium]